MIIAIVMRAAAEHAAWVPPAVWALKGMQGAYAFVKEKSPCVGPNMSYVIRYIHCRASLIYASYQAYLSADGIRKEAKG